jgi:parallel beta-helix repeat protein
LSTELPTITDTVTIDGTSQLATARVEIDGRIMTVNANGLSFSATAGGSTVRAVSIGYFYGNGINVAAGCDGNTFAGNYIGVRRDGTTYYDNTGDGILVSSANNTIGGTTAADRNVIAGNDSIGVAFQGAGAGNVVRGNYIGVTASGSTQLYNDSGVLVQNSAGVTITGNLISGNKYDGIQVNGGSGTVIQGNTIGLNAAGTAAVKNGAKGISIWGDSSNVIIGGTTAAQRNVISGNGSRGINVENGTNITGLVVSGNYIGLNAGGTVAFGNLVGVYIGSGVSGATIGGTAAGAGNVISGNTVDGPAARRRFAVRDGGRQHHRAQRGRYDGAAQYQPGHRHLQQLEQQHGRWHDGGARNVISGNGGRGITLGSSSNKRRDGQLHRPRCQRPVSRSRTRPAAS